MSIKLEKFILLVSLASILSIGIINAVAVPQMQNLNIHNKVSIRSVSTIIKPYHISTTNTNTNANSNSNLSIIIKHKMSINSVPISALLNTYKLYIGQSITKGPFKVVFEDLGATNGTSSAPASFNIYYNNTIISVIQMLPNTSKTFKIDNTTLFMSLVSTSQNTYSNQSWATVKISVFPLKSHPIHITNITNITLGQKLYIGQSITEGPFKLVLGNISISKTGPSYALFSILYNGKFVNITYMFPHTEKTFKIGNATLFVGLFGIFENQSSNQSWVRVLTKVSYSAPNTSTLGEK
ncbi:MAG: hypothetical protein ACP5LH_03610, partial [Candidatus Micrarchaeia archaeon]